MLYEIAHRFPKDMILKEDGPLISLYQPTHRTSPDNKQDPILFKKLLKNIENSLKQVADLDFIESIMQPLQEIKDDKYFWNNTNDGLAVFASKSGCVVYHLNDAVQELTVVADSFHIIPLIKAFQTVVEYQVLGLSRENFSLYQGNRFGIEEIKPDPAAPRTMQEVLGDQLSEIYLSFGAHAGAGSPQTFHAYSDAKREMDKDTEKYFRYVDAFVTETYSKASKLPLILASLAEYQTEFMSLSKNPYLLKEGIHKSIDAMDLDELTNRAALIVEGRALEKIHKLLESFGEFESAGRASVDLEHVVKAACAGRVETLLIETEKIIPGKIDSDSGLIVLNETLDPGYDDLLDDLAEMVLTSGGKVKVLAREQMPGTSGVAAIYRYS